MNSADTSPERPTTPSFADRMVATDTAKRQLNCASPEEDNTKSNEEDDEGKEVFVDDKNKSVLVEVIKPKSPSKLFNDPNIVEVSDVAGELDNREELSS